jgi:hypothetical protein
VLPALHNKVAIQRGGAIPPLKLCLKSGLDDKEGFFMRRIILAPSWAVVDGAVSRVSSLSRGHIDCPPAGCYSAPAVGWGETYAPKVGDVVTVRDYDHRRIKGSIEDAPEKLAKALQKVLAREFDGVDNLTLVKTATCGSSGESTLLSVRVGKKEFLLEDFEDKLQKLGLTTSNPIPPPWEAGWVEE